MWGVTFPSSSPFLMLNTVVLLSIVCINLVLKDGLSKNFSNVDIEVVDCPDLREKPWTLAAPGTYI